MPSLGPGTLGPASLGAREARARVALRDRHTTDTNKEMARLGVSGLCDFCYHESIGLDTVRDDYRILAGEGTF